MATTHQAVIALASPELRKAILAWEYRSLLAGCGLIAAWILVRLRISRQASSGQEGTDKGGWPYLLCFYLGAIVSAGLWIGFDLLRDENCMGQLLAALPPQSREAVQALLVVVLGLSSWAVASGEVLWWLVLSDRNQLANVPTRSTTPQTGADASSPFPAKPDDRCR